MNSFLYDKRITRTVSEINILVYILNTILVFWYYHGKNRTIKTSNL